MPRHIGAAKDEQRFLPPCGDRQTRSSRALVRRTVTGRPQGVNPPPRRGDGLRLPHPNRLRRSARWPSKRLRAHACVARWHKRTRMTLLDDNAAYSRDAPAALTPRGPPFGLSSVRPSGGLRGGRWLPQRHTRHLLRGKVFRCSARQSDRAARGASGVRRSSWVSSRSSASWPLNREVAASAAAAGAGLVTPGSRTGCGASEGAGRISREDGVFASPDCCECVVPRP